MRVGANMLEGSTAAADSPWLPASPGSMSVPALGRREADRGWGLPSLGRRWALRTTNAPLSTLHLGTPLTDRVPSLKLALCVASALGSCVPLRARPSPWQP